MGVRVLLSNKGDKWVKLPSCPHTNGCLLPTQSQGAVMFVERKISLAILFYFLFGQYGVDLRQINTQHIKYNLKRPIREDIIGTPNYS